MAESQGDNRVPVCQRDDYTIYFEQLSTGLTFVHVDVRKWTPTAKRGFKKDLDSVFELHGGPLYAMVGAGMNKLGKFIALVGGQYSTSVIDANGELQHIFVRSK